MNRIDSLKKVRDRGEGILSVTLAPTGTKDFSKLLERVDFLDKCGLNQLLLIYYEPNSMKIGGIAPAELKLVKQEMMNGTSTDMFLDNADAIRKSYPNLPLIATVNVGEALCYGTKRLFTKFKKIGIDGIDTPSYLAVDDPVSFRMCAESSGIHFIGAIYANFVNMDNPAHIQKIDNLVKVCRGEILFVPTDQGATKALKGDGFRPLIHHIREIQKQNNIDANIIAISGINTPEDAYQMVHVAGTDGVHFSSAFIKRLLADESYENISSWLKEVKNAMKKTPGGSL